MKFYSIIIKAVLVLKTVLSSDITYINDLEELVISGIAVNSIPLRIFRTYKHAKIVTITNTSLKAIPTGLELFTHPFLLRYTYNVETTDYSNLYLAMHMSYLILENNNMTSLVVIPANLKNLRKVSLKGNKLTHIPYWIQTLDQITWLDVSNNKIHSLFPSIGNMNDLTCLNLSSNFLNELNYEIAKLQNLKTLNLSDNRFSSIPAEVCVLDKLTFLDLSHNFISEFTPNIEYTIAFYEWGIMKFRLDSPTIMNNLVCTFKQKLESYRIVGFLNVLKFSEAQCINILAAKLKSFKYGILDLPNLHDLCLSYNDIKVIPNDLINLKKLRILQLSHNLIEEFPIFVIVMKKLKILHLSQNKIKLLPKHFILFKEYESINLEHNYIGESCLKKFETYKNYMQCKSLKIQKQNVLPMSVEDVLNTIKKQDLHWNVDILNTIKMETNVIELAKDISNDLIKEVWNRILKYFVDNEYESKRKVFGTLNGDRREDSEMKLLFGSNLDPLTPFNIKSLIEEISVSGILPKESEETAILQSNKELFEMVDNYLNNLSANELDNGDETTNNTGKKLNSYIKVIFATYLKKLYLAGNNSSDIDAVRISLTSLCSICLGKCITGQLVNLYFYYSIIYLDTDQQCTNEVVILAKKHLAMIKEKDFTSIVVDTKANNVHRVHQYKSVFKDLIGIFCDFTDPYTDYTIDITELNKGAILSLFFEVFTIERVLTEILDKINLDIGLIGDALCVLHLITDNETNYEKEALVLKDEDSCAESQWFYNYNKAIDLYFDYSILSCGNYNYTKLKFCGLKKIFIHLNIIEENKK